MVEIRTFSYILSLMADCDKISIEGFQDADGGFERVKQSNGW